MVSEPCKIKTHRHPSSSASTVHDPRSMLPCGPSMRPSVAISHCAWCTPSTQARPTKQTPRAPPRKLATAEIAVRYAFMAVESADKPVKIEVEILQDRPIRALLDASRSAAVICVGSIGLQSSTQGRIGSTAAALAASAHCPAAVVRGHDPQSASQRCVVAEVDEYPASNGVLLRGLKEARLRGAALHVLTTWQSRFTDVYDGHAVADGNRLAKAQLDRRLAQWTKRYPEVDVRAVAVHGNTLNYIAKNASLIQLVVVGHERGGGIMELVGPPADAALHDTACSVLICEPRNVL